MRFALVPFAAVVCTACLGLPSEPLQVSDRSDTLVVERGEAQLGRLGFDIAEPRATPVNEAPPEEAPAEEAPAEESPVEDPAREALVQEIALTIGFAADVSYSAAEAGNLRDVALAEQSADEAFAAAELIQQRVAEVMNFSTAGGEGCAGGEIAEPTTGDPELDEAVFTAFVAAEAAAEVASELAPESQVVCGAGCGGTCETVPGEVDEVALNDAIASEIEAGDACGALEESIAL